MKTQLLSIALVSMFVSVNAVIGSAQPKLGGYNTAATDSELVVGAAQFAVSKRAETNPEQEGLSLGSVDKAESQTVATFLESAEKTRVNFGSEATQTMFMASPRVSSGHGWRSRVTALKPEVRWRPTLGEGAINSPLAPD